MSTEFDRKIHDTLADANLQLAVYTATGRLKDNRIETRLRPTPCPTTRSCAPRPTPSRSTPSSNLDHYLEEFERNVEAHGGKVVYCKDGTEVADFVLGLAKERGAHLIVKSKSMTTEEVDLNERLEHHGLESVETDLGEYILQLAHERPYHIVAPALHMTRYDVADLFTERLRVPRETVIEKQTAHGALGAAAEVSGGRYRDQRRQLPGGRFGRGGHRRKRGQRAAHHFGAEDPHRHRRHRESDSARAGPGDVSEAAGAQRHGAVALASTRRSSAARGAPARSTARTSSTWCCSITAARACWPDRGQAAIALLHPLRGVPEHLPGVPQDRRPQLSVGVLGADRRHPHAAVHGRAARAGAAVRLQPVRRLRARSAR